MAESEWTRCVFNMVRADTCVMTHTKCMNYTYTKHELNSIEVFTVSVLGVVT